MQALRAARTAGWTIAIVSNGGTGPQLEKIRRTGLGALVDAWVVSEEAGCAKPDPLIFEIAAQRCGVGLADAWAAEAWVIGDHGPADIAGADLAGIRSVWLRHGRRWSERSYRPTLCAPGLPEAIALVLAEQELSGPAAVPTVGTPHPGSRYLTTPRLETPQLGTAREVSNERAAVVG